MRCELLKWLNNVTVKKVDRKTKDVNGCTVEAMENRGTL
jgi:hypothetical protein